MIWIWDGPGASSLGSKTGRLRDSATTIGGASASNPGSDTHRAWLLSEGLQWHHTLIIGIGLKPGPVVISGKGNDVRCCWACTSASLRLKVDSVLLETGITARRLVARRQRKHDERAG